MNLAAQYELNRIGHDEDAARHRAALAAAIGATPTTAVERKVRKTIEDVEWLLGTDTPTNIAHRLGYGSVNALSKFLARYERDDLVARLGWAKEAA